MSNTSENSQNTTAGTEFVAPRHWLGMEELSPDYWSDEAIKTKRSQEFYDKPIETLELIEKLDTKGMARRDFLTVMGASMALAGMACARRPVHKIIPYVVKPEEITAGVANYYATACPETGVALLAKVREGRPIKLEGRPFLSARDQAHILDLYDPARAKSSYRLKRGVKGSEKALSLDEAHTEIAARLAPLKSGRGRVVVLSAPTRSEIQADAARAFASSFPQGAYHVWAPECATGLAQTQRVTNSCFEYDFTKADFVLSVGDDILGAHPESAKYLNQWSRTRKLDATQAGSAKLSKWIVAEPTLSLTGSNADERFTVHPNQMLTFLARVASATLKAKGLALPSEIEALIARSGGLEIGVADRDIQKIGKALAENAGKSAILSGAYSTNRADSEALAKIASYLNETLGNYGKTVSLISGVNSPSEILNSAGLYALTRQMAQQSVDAVVIQGWNPLYDLPADYGFLKVLSQVPLVVRVNDRIDETAIQSDYLLAESHFLESWGDVVDVASGKVLIQQPTISPLYATESFTDALLALIAKAELKPKVMKLKGSNAYEALKAQSGSEMALDKTAAWEGLLREGSFESRSVGSKSSLMPAFGLAGVSAKKPEASEWTWVSYEKVSMGNGSRANNPWLQELPDPVTTATWDNYAVVGPETAQTLKLLTNDVLKISGQNGSDIELPVLVMPGVAKGVIAGALGYGRQAVGEVGSLVGKDVKNLYKVGPQGEWDWSGFPIKVSKTGKRYQIAITQWHNASENRPIINDISIVDFKRDPASAAHTDPHLRLDPVPTMWKKHEYKGYRWGMSVDLTSCSGCGACVVACQAENNIPVVGRDNVRKSREMHWMRIDRYFSGSPTKPDVIFQPMMCQHCENAPCETVCPVLATVHDDEGLNSQIYNRCVGTRYCQNNCPYKTRRFNFFDHWKSYEGNMNLSWNPDVTVRSRGIMEKCTFCVQRIHDVKDKAKDLGRSVRDGELKTACQETCPSQAITFGNVNDPNSQVSKLRVQSHGFRSLEVLNTVPMVTYLSKVRNREESALSHAGDHDTKSSKDSKHKETGNHG